MRNTIWHWRSNTIIPVSNTRQRSAAVAQQYQCAIPVLRKSVARGVQAAGGLAVGAWHEFRDPRAAAVAANLLDYLLCAPVASPVAAVVARPWPP